MLDGKSAPITGSLGGIGFATAKAPVAPGREVMANGFGDAGAIAARVAEIQRLGLRAARHTADSRDPMQIAGMIEDTANAHGSPGSLVNNAVVRYFGTEDNFAPEHGDEAIAVNLPATKAKGRAGSSAWPRSTAISRR